MTLTLLWSLTNVFHLSLGRVERALDHNEADQRRSQRDQDGSDIRTVELERLLAEGLSLVERVSPRTDARCGRHPLRTPSWRMLAVVHRLARPAIKRFPPAAVIDSSDFIAAKALH